MFRVETTGWAWMANRNGIPDLTAVVVTTRQAQGQAGNVHIGGEGLRGPLRGGLDLSMETMRDLCTKFLVEQGYVVIPLDSQLPLDAGQGPGLLRCGHFLPGRSGERDLRLRAQAHARGIGAGGVRGPDDHRRGWVLARPGAGGEEPGFRGGCA